MNEAGFNGSADRRMAKAILGNRRLRRLWLARSLMVVLVQLGLGLWAIEPWLAQRPVMFLLWWLACAVVAVWVIVFALYDALMVIREERADREK